MNEWKILELDNLPPDIFSSNKKYEVEYKTTSFGWLPSNNYRNKEYGKIINMLQARQEYRYRRKQKPAPTHEEIMTRWWRIVNAWYQVASYNGDGYYHICGKNVKSEWFDRESADIPPESK